MKKTHIERLTDDEVCGLCGKSHDRCNCKASDFGLIAEKGFITIDDEELEYEGELEYNED